MEETNLKEKETEEKMKNTGGGNKEIKVKEKNNNIGCYNFDYTCCYISFIYSICYYEY